MTESMHLEAQVHIAQQRLVFAVLTRDERGRASARLQITRLQEQLAPVLRRGGQPAARVRAARRARTARAAAPAELA